MDIKKLTFDKKIEKKQSVNITLDKDLYERLQEMRAYFNLNWSARINNFLWEDLELMEKQLEKERPEDYKKYIKKFKEGS